MYPPSVLLCACTVRPSPRCPRPSARWTAERGDRAKCESVRDETNETYIHSFSTATFDRDSIHLAQLNFDKKQEKKIERIDSDRMSSISSLDGPKKGTFEKRKATKQPDNLMAPEKINSSAKKNRKCEKKKHKANREKDLSMLSFLFSFLHISTAATHFCTKADTAPTHPRRIFFLRTRPHSRPRHLSCPFPPMSHAQPFLPRSQEKRVLRSAFPRFLSLSHSARRSNERKRKRVHSRPRYNYRHCLVSINFRARSNFDSDAIEEEERRGTDLTDLPQS